ncbi:hypothetical protein FAM23167_02672 [Lentilactobacillus parabuchneri]|nr:hypothetical protein FAM23164_02696 [Lentilactobacillus parabuchneri]ORN14044.1 hypothetical protein FAM23165_02695 [Lentilactobacillus parabuchneri]ORN16935.1 hypothetical protein FAM23166_02695 [Lentilactobacillus parabuchneri]ORN19786.1 hypothetical protein FAM23167_02672 [Lentilactobacillus parabuchneri]
MFSVVTKYHKGRHSLFLYNSEIFYAFTQDILRSLNYLTTTNLYHKNPSYCSKYVYLAYWWGTSYKGMKGGLMWVFPFSMTNVFSGTYKPSYIYKLTTK